MRTTLALATLAVGSLLATTARGDDDASSAPPARRSYVGTSLFVLANVVPDDYPPHFYQLNAGYQLTARDRLSVEAITWRYYHPIGIPWGEDRTGADEAYPGHIREYGLGLAYQRLVWKGGYAAVEAVPFWRTYHDLQDDKLGSGFELFLTLRLGYHVRFFDRVFFGPSVAFNAWPITTDVPAGFATMDERWPSYFLFEPGLHVGVLF